MIIMLLLGLIFEILDLAFYAVDPITSLPLGITSSIHIAYGFVHFGTHVFPFLSVAIPFMLLAFTAESGYFLYQIIMRIVKIIRGAG